MSAGPASARVRIRARVDGTVQGVGYRPFVHRLAAERGIAGFVRNDARGVLVEAEGPPGAVAAFVRALADEAPPLAVVEAVTPEPIPPTGRAGFAIVASAGGAPAAPVTPDAATCADCLREVFDPADRRHRYPFANCTNCGPRFTIVRGVPYDRPNTTMAGFAMCADCQAEYDDPGDRRFHAQPNACPACGPAATLADAAGAPLPLAGGAADAVAAAAARLRDGGIVAVKGLGGYHLACRAGDETAVAALRARKHREEKPFALMVRDVAAARALAEITGEAEALLRSPAAPIVLVPRRPGAPVAPSVAPRSPDLGLMLPATPLHHLLLADAGEPLVMTSGNVSDEPIAYEDSEARARLGRIADAFLVHDRPIETRVDDSVVRAVDAGDGPRPQLLRRSRGHVPAALALPVPAPLPMLAVGAELKSTFCLAKGGRAWVGHHIGDLENWETLRAFREGIGRFEDLFDVRPEAVAHDLHPGYLSTAEAQAREDLPLIGVQHHHAHLAAVLAEHGEAGPAVGLIFDGTGHGPDGTVWGGEILAGGLDGFERAGWLAPARLPGGERAIREPWRMACAWLLEAGRLAPEPPPALAADVPPDAWRAVAGLARAGTAAPVTTSMGRLFDAAAALCGVRARVSYEGQAAIEFQALADPGERGAYGLPVGGADPAPGPDAGAPPGLVLEGGTLIAAVAADVADGAPVPAISARFHAAVAAGSARAAAQAAGARGLDTVVLSGGVFQNALLLRLTAAALREAGLRVLVPELLPPNDGGISFGQAAVAAARLAG
ncbi:MAG: carbamoyltransferase HypF [Solirubrobacteraceae bacterium]